MTARPTTSAPTIAGTSSSRAGRGSPPTGPSRRAPTGSWLAPGAPRRARGLPMTEGARYVPAAGRAAFTRLYDPAFALTMRERRLRPLLAEQLLASLPPGGTVVDIG